MVNRARAWLRRAASFGGRTAGQAAQPGNQAASPPAARPPAFVFIPIGVAAPPGTFCLVRRASAVRALS